VQDVLLALHRHRHTYDPSRPVAPWLYAIARHRLLDAVKKRNRRARRELLDDTSRDGVPRLDELPAASVPAVHEYAGHLPRALEHLSSAQREVIELLKLDGYTIAEIAEKTGRTPSSVKVLAHRGYKLLRQLLGGPFRDD